MTEFKCDRCGRKGYDLYRISLNEFYKDGKYSQPYGVRNSTVGLCQACFEEISNFLASYDNKEVIKNDRN